MYNIASDKWNLGKVVELVLISLGIIVLAFYSVNVDRTTIQQNPDIFWILGLSSLIIIILGFLIKNINSKYDLNIPIWEEGLLKIDYRYDKLIIIFSVILGLFTFFTIGLKSGVFKYTIDAPFYSAVKVNTMGNALLSFVAAMMEDIFFFAAMPGLLFFLFYLLAKNPIISIIFLILFNPFIFTLFHARVYGFSDIVNSIATFVFGLEMTLFMIFVGRIAYCHLRHGFNNAALIIFSQMSISYFILSILSSIWFWFVIIFSVFIFVIRKLNR